MASLDADAAAVPLALWKAAEARNEAFFF